MSTIASMAAVQAEDVRASFLFVGDLNGYHLEWLGSTTTNSHGVAAFDFTIVSGCDQFTTHATRISLYLSINNSNLLLTDQLVLQNVKKL